MEYIMTNYQQLHYLQAKPFGVFFPKNRVKVACFTQRLLKYFGRQVENHQILFAGRNLVLSQKCQ